MRSSCLSVGTKPPLARCLPAAGVTTQSEHCILQGNTPDLLPEQLLGTIRFSNLDLRLAKHLDPLQHRQLSHMGSSTGSSGRRPTSPPPVAWPNPGSGPSRLSSVGSGHLLSMAEESSRQHKAAMRNNGSSLGSRSSDPAALEHTGRQTFWGSPHLTPQATGSGSVHAAAQTQHHSYPQPTGSTTTAASDELFSMKYDGSRGAHRSEPQSSLQRSDSSLQRRRSHSDGARHS